MQRKAAITLLFTLALVAQSRGPLRKPADQQDDPARLPNGKSQQEAIIKEDHEKDLADSRELAKIATELKEEIEKDDAHILNVASIKKTEEIEKLAKRIRGRMRRF